MTPIVTVSVAEPLGNQEFHGSPGEFRRGVAEQLFGLLVESHDGTVPVHHDCGVRHDGQERGQQF
jgi:hypothetical protein